MKRIVAAFDSNTVFANILLVLILLAGGIAAMSMIRENFPEFSVDIITISVAYRGADPEEVEEGISRKIEEAFEGLEGVNRLHYVTNCHKKPIDLNQHIEYKIFTNLSMPLTVLIQISCANAKLDFQVTMVWLADRQLCVRKHIKFEHTFVHTILRESSLWR